MRKLKLQLLVVVCGLPLLFSGCTERRSEWDTLLEKVATGNSAARQTLLQRTKESPTMAYDGCFRLCMVKDKYEDEGYHECDLLSVVPLTKDANMTYDLIGPAQHGMVVKSVAFEGDDLIVLYWPAAPLSSDSQHTEQLLTWRLGWPSDNAVDVDVVNQRIVKIRRHGSE